MSIKEELPNGICSRCRQMPLMKRDGQKFCPNCDTQAEPSGLVNNLPDPGHEAMMAGNLPHVKNDTINIAKVPLNATIPQIPRGNMSLEDITKQIDSLPMPSDMKSIKKLLKVKELLNQLVKGE